MHARPTRRSVLRRGTVTVAVSLVILAACDLDPVEPDPPVLMTGTLAPVDPDRLLAGSVAAITQFGNTQISMAVHGMEPGETLRWHLREGTCSGDGDIFGSPSAYPPLEADDEGGAEESIDFGLRLRPGRSYSAEVVPSVGVTGAGAFACADLGQE